jgi:hypothetical protein
MSRRQEDERQQRRQFKADDEERALGVAASRLLQQCHLRPRACIRRF